MNGSDDSIGLILPSNPLAVIMLRSMGRAALDAGSKWSWGRLFVNWCQINHSGFQSSGLSKVMFPFAEVSTRRLNYSPNDRTMVRQSYLIETASFFGNIGHSSSNTH